MNKTTNSQKGKFDGSALFRVYLYVYMYIYILLRFRNGAFV